MALPWTAQPDTAVLLAQCAARPPATRCHSVHYALTSDHDVVYTGALARRLRALWKAERDRLWAAAETSGDYGAFAAHCGLTPDRAIREAIAATSAPMLVAAE